MTGEDVKGGWTPADAEAMAQDAFDKLRRLAGMIESDDDIIQQCGGLRIRVYEAGQYPSKDNPKEMIDYPRGIEVRVGGLKIIPEASDIAMLIHHIKNNRELGMVLRTRLKEEQELMKELNL